MADAREEGSKPKIKRNWSEHPTLRFLMVTFLLFGLYWSYGYLTGPSKITGRLHAQLGKNPSEVNVSVTTVFPPEEFHISIYQNLGSMRGIREKTAALYSMTPANIRNLSRYYWIHQIDLIPGK